MLPSKSSRRPILSTKYTPMKVHKKFTPDVTEAIQMAMVLLAMPPI